jgi:dTDP-4-amino-4,6-dideoxygalactose transaminase
MDALRALADEHGLVLIEDAAHALGARWRGEGCGSMGAAGCFSFFANKNLPIGEGGLVVTDDDAFAATVRLLRSHGMTTLTLDRARGHAASYDVTEAGFNYRLDEVRAAMGAVQLRRLDAYNAARRRLVGLYREGVAPLDGVTMPFADVPAHATSGAHLAVVLLPEGADRSGVRERMRAAGVQTSVHYPPIHTFSTYAGVGRVRPLPRTDDVAARILTLPLFPHLRDDQVDRVLGALRDAL